MLLSGNRDQDPIFVVIDHPAQSHATYWVDNGEHLADSSVLKASPSRPRPTEPRDELRVGNIAEIDSDRVLQWYGAALALVNVVTAVFWLREYPVGRILSPRTTPICWPFFTDCYRLRILSPEVLSLGLWAFGALCLANAYFFISGRTVVAYWLLATLSGLKAFIILLDYRLILNQHYMAFWILVPFLWLSNKRALIRTLLVCFYVWAGTLKISPGSGWFTAGALYGSRPLGLPSSWIPLECFYVVALELVSVWGLLSARAWLFWAALVQFVLFHVASFWVVGFFYPLEMFLLLTIWPTSRLIPGPDPAQVPKSVAFPRLIVSAPQLAVLFSVFQLVPHFFPGVPAVTGEGRMFALNMFDAPVRCNASFTFYEGSAPGRTIPVNPPFTNPRLICDPIVYWSLATSFCRLHSLDRAESDFRLQLSSGAVGRDKQVTVDIDHFCEARPSYSLLRHNAWIESVGHPQ
jgi:hypothetical protein